MLISFCVVYAGGIFISYLQARKEISTMSHVSKSEALCNKFPGTNQNK